jgi:hypothetical protein
MPLDDRLRGDFNAAARGVDPAVETALASVRAAARRSEHRRRMGALATLAAAAALVVGLVAWWRPGLLRSEDRVVVPPPTGTYETRLAGDLDGTWRLRLDGGAASLVAPTDAPLGTRSVEAPYEVRGDTLTLALLDGEGCDDPGRYTWDLDGGLRLIAADDECALRRRVLTSAAWRPVGVGGLRPGTYQSPTLTYQAMRATAIAAGFAPPDVDDYLRSSFPGAATLRYTLTVNDAGWTVFASADGGAPGVIWSGPYRSPDAATVVAGEPPCGPVTFDVQVRPVAALRIAVIGDDCRENGVLPVGELIAGVTIYEVADFRRVGD